jgi:hypothetical protein
VDTIKNAPWTFVAMAGIALLSIVLDALFRRSGRDSSSAPACVNRAT